LAARLLQVPGASAYVRGGVIAYDNRIKTDLLAVKPEDLTLEGAVSSTVVRTMAQEACRLLHCDYAVAISGIAGPDGGSPEKPVGTVFFGIHGPEGTLVYQRSLGEGRPLVVERAVMMAMFLLWRILIGQALPDETPNAVKTP
jgi:nicotinamide-nucleotide amidase